MDIVVVSRAELRAEIREAISELINNQQQMVNREENETQQPTIIRGINGLAAFLGVSVPTAQKMKNEKVFPCVQRGRTIFFRADEVIAGISKKRKK